MAIYFSRTLGFLRNNPPKSIGMLFSDNDKREGKKYVSFVDANGQTLG